MTERKDEANELRLAESVGVALYKAHGEMLQSFMTRKFGVPPEAAESLVFEMFINYCGGEKTLPKDTKAWLIATACNGAKTYLQRNGLSVTDSPDDARETENLLFCRGAMASLPESARRALQLRFQERRTYEEIATELDVTARYAKLLVMKAGVKLRQVIREGREKE